MTNYSAWDVRTSNFPQTSKISDQIAFLCRYGVLAPSVHNTQPWALEIADDELLVRIAESRRLASGDPTGRETWISIGAMIENILVAGAYLGLNGDIKNPDEDGVRIRFKHTQAVTTEESLLQAIPKRWSNRNSYTEKAVPDEILAKLAELSTEDTDVVPVTDALVIELLADRTGRAIEIALGNPEFRGELSGLVHKTDSKHHIGMPTSTLGVHGARAAVEDKLIRSGVFRGAQGKKEFESVRSSPLIVLVFTAGDSRPFWINAGRAYQRAALVCTSAGLSSATLAAAVEASDYHLDIEKACNTEKRLQSVMRVGYSDSKPQHSPRLPLEDVLTVSS